MRFSDARMRLRFRQRFAWCRHYCMSLRGEMLAQCRKWMESKAIVAHVP